MIRDFENKGWAIDVNSLVIPENKDKHFNSTPALFESPDGRFACLFYLIGEYRMMCYAGLLSVYTNKSAPEKLFNPEHWFGFEFDRSVFFCGDYLLVRQLEMFNSATKDVFAPFIVFNLASLSVGLVDFDFTSIYYNIIQIDKSKIAFKLTNPNELSGLRAKVRNCDGKVVDLTELGFRPLSDFEVLMTKYAQSKNTKI